MLCVTRITAKQWQVKWGVLAVKYVHMFVIKIQVIAVVDNDLVLPNSRQYGVCVCVSMHIWEGRKMF